MACRIGETCRKWCSLIGVGLMLFPTGSSYFWGNAYVYVSSYIVHRLGTENGAYGPWVLSIQIAVSAIVAVYAGFIRSYVGNDACVLGGIVCVCANSVIAYFAIQNSGVLFTVLYGVLFGLSLGLLMNNAINFLLEWMDKGNAGVYIAFSRSGKFIGAVLANKFITVYVNPNNLKADSRKGPTPLFTQAEVLDRVPHMILYLGLGLSVSTFAGFLLVKIANSKPLASNRNCHGNASNGYRSFGMENKVTDNLRERSDESRSRPIVDSSPSPSTSLQEVEEDLDRTSFTTRQMVKSKTFYVLFVTLALSYMTNLIVTNYYKSFGQTWIHDDHFLADIGTLIPVINIFSTLVWGKCMDRCGVKNFLVFFYAALPLLCLFYYFTAIVNEWFYVIVTWVLSAVSSAIFNTFNIATIKVFGRKHHASNFAVLHLATLSDLILSPVIKVILLEFGWFYLFLFAASMNVTALIVVVIFCSQAVG